MIASAQDRDRPNRRELDQKLTAAREAADNVAERTIESSRRGLATLRGATTRRLRPLYQRKPVNTETRLSPKTTNSGIKSFAQTSA